MDVANSESGHRFLHLLEIKRSDVAIFGMGKGAFQVQGSILNIAKKETFLPYYYLKKLFQISYIK